MSELIERLQQGCKVVAKLASSRGESFRMCIPPQKDDTDIFLIDAMKEAITALEAVPAWANGQTLTEDDLCDWLTEHAWDASEDDEPVYVVDKEALQGLFKNTILVLAPPTTQSDGG